MEIHYCTKHAKRATSKIWLYRICGFILIYLSLSFPKNISLSDTALIMNIRRQYPSWKFFIYEIILSLMILGLFALLFNALYLYVKKYKIKTDFLNIIQKSKSRFTRSFIVGIRFLARWTIGVSIALLLWFSFVKFLSAIYEFLEVPLYAENPILVVAGVLGIALCIESLDTWSETLRKKFCMFCGEAGETKI